MSRVTASRKPRVPDVLGWREIIALPDFGIPEMNVKIDTGARTSALHAVDQELFERQEEHWVRFCVPRPCGAEARVEARVVDSRDIKNTSGIPERRIVIATLIVLGRHHWHVEASLTNRENMEFDMILGRTAIRGRGVLIDPGKSYRAGKPQARMYPALTDHVRRSDQDRRKP